MARPKIPRKSTHVDMTAMCDVAFLLLTFFILATKFKPSEAVPVNTPNSVASKIAPETNVVMITLNKDNQAYLSMSDTKDDLDNKRQMISYLNTTRNLGLSDAEVDALVQAPLIGVPLSQLKQEARMSKDDMNAKNLPGIPIKDSANNEMVDWLRAVQETYQGKKEPNLIFKGDNEAKYVAFKNVIDALKRNDFFKFQMVTNPESVPAGTDLFKQGGSED